MARSGIKGYHFLLILKKKILSDDAEKKSERVYELGLINKTDYNELILKQ